jgi:cytidylate kinase
VRVIAIDGPAGSGKSTVARRVAGALGLAYLDTGAMYRSVAFAALRAGIDPADADAVTALAEGISIEVGDRVTEDGVGRVIVDGVDATDAIRGAEVTTAVSTVAANPGVRAAMVRRQRAWADARGGGVAEGRDIGTVVFPGADLKVYLTANEDERARRRAQELGQPAYDQVAADIARRDKVDSTRAASPMMVAEDALVIDTTGRTIDEIVEEVLSKL